MLRRLQTAMGDAEGALAARMAIGPTDLAAIQKLPDVAAKLSAGDTWNDEAEKALFESQLNR